MVYYIDKEIILILFVFYFLENTNKYGPIKIKKKKIIAKHKFKFNKNQIKSIN